MNALADTLSSMCGVWHDVLHAFHPDGTAMAEDTVGSTQGPFPYDNLVYVDFDGTTYRQTNVTFRGRPLKVRSFEARVTGGVLRFARLGPEDPGHVGVGAGHGRLVFCAARNDQVGTRAYDEPDVVELLDEHTRRRTTILYRHGALVRTMAVTGTRVAATAGRRVPLDPRGIDGPVHELPSTTLAFTGGTDA
jgi:hypothetical protein